ncbi:rhodanese-like domain-containing protein [Cellulophaga baltica]|uniref:Rhodanese-related sulfurtransferase n=1 Tax=Cellulophaga baltica TaxID=76594 RepID=A0A1G7G2K6_9FLAO|nr:rhodanese-like domain-containing protein [Cellulophaga baltica]AIY14816.1 rhodanese [Cellulophaga baltica NN016038]SDE82310.1 Rhodanese-related sulfurtransferase [Cellulophaga baltica]
MSFLNFLFGNKNSDSITTINVIDYKAAISDKRVQLVDVRTPNEFSRGAIKKAVNIDFFNTTVFENAFNKFKKDEPLYIYCQSGMRSKRAANKLAKMGFTDIIDLKGGYMAYK